MDCRHIIKKWKEKPITNFEDIDIKLHNFRILFAYHSGKIENKEINYHDTREIFENKKISNYTGNIKTLFEQQNQQDTYEYIKKIIIKKKVISLDLIKTIHFELCKGTYTERRFSKGEKPGEFKKHDYVVGYYDVGTDAENVEKELLELINEVESYKGDQIIKVAAYFHLKFEQIHPFADGNGRVGRTLMNYYLIKNNHPPIIIFEEDRKSYYESLEKFDKDEEIEPFISFLMLQLIKTWDKKMR